MPKNHNAKLLTVVDGEMMEQRESKLSFENTHSYLCVDGSNELIEDTESLIPLMLQRKVLRGERKTLYQLWRTAAFDGGFPVKDLDDLEFAKRLKQKNMGQRLLSLCGLLLRERSGERKYYEASKKVEDAFSSELTDLVHQGRVKTYMMLVRSNGGMIMCSERFENAIKAVQEDGGGSHVIADENAHSAAANLLINADKRLATNGTSIMFHVENDDLMARLFSQIMVGQNMDTIMGRRKNLREAILRACREPDQRRSIGLRMDNECGASMSADELREKIKYAMSDDQERAKTAKRIMDCSLTLDAAEAQRFGLVDRILRAPYQFDDYIERVMGKTLADSTPVRNFLKY